MISQVFPCKLSQIYTTFVSVWLCLTFKTCQIVACASMIRQFHEFFNIIFGGFLTFGTTVSRHRHALLSCVHAYILNTSRLFGLSLAILRNWLSYSIQGLEMNRIFMYYIPPPPGPAPGFISFLLHSFCSCCTVDNVLSIYLYIFRLFDKASRFQSRPF